MPHLRRILFELNRGEMVSEKARKALRVVNYSAALAASSSRISYT